MYDIDISILKEMFPGFAENDRQEVLDSSINFEDAIETLICKSE